MAANTKDVRNPGVFGEQRMEVDDFIEPEVGVAVAITAAVASPAVRKALRKSAVYGLAGALMAGDAIALMARGVKNGVLHHHAGGAPAADGPAGESVIAAASEPATLVLLEPAKSGTKGKAHRETEAHA
jgi:hypothetical protein